MVTRSSEITGFIRCTSTTEPTDGNDPRREQDLQLTKNTKNENVTKDFSVCPAILLHRCYLEIVAAQVFMFLSFDVLDDRTPPNQDASIIGDKHTNISSARQAQVYRLTF